MKYIGFDDYLIEEYEPALRSCWECNPAHERLKDVTFLHSCPWCGKQWIYGKSLDEFNTAEALDEFLKAHLEHVEATDEIPDP